MMKGKVESAVITARTNLGEYFEYMWKIVREVKTLFWGALSSLCVCAEPRLTIRWNSPGVEPEHLDISDLQTPVRVP